ncbi:MAG: AMP-binding protein [Dehalococcoidia bacterium]|nr:AMP-binding protein [Dehalococcoidia bacterium]
MPTLRPDITGGRMPDSLPYAALSLPDLHYQPREAINALQDRNLRQMIALCAERHPFYRRRFAEHGVDPARIRSTHDLTALPITTKYDFAADPDAFRLETDGLSLEERVVREFVSTTGTTANRPAPIAVTTFDYYAYLEHARHCSAIAGVTEADLIANVFPLTAAPLGGFVRAHSTAAATGCPVLTLNPGRADASFPVHRRIDEVIRLIARHRATILYGVASYVRTWLIRAQTIGADFSHVRACMVSGEPVSAAMRDDMIRRMRAFGQPSPRVINRYGMTEVGSFIECVDGAGWHNPSPEQVFLEVVDPQTLRRLPNGEKGLLLVTHLLRRGTVLLRYAPGDLVAITEAPCPHCGRTSERIVAQPVRTADLVKVKGMLVNLTALSDELAAIDGLDEHQIVIRKRADDPFSLDELALNLVASPDRRESVAAEATRRTALATNIRPTIQFVSMDALVDPDDTSKFRRALDLRPPVPDDLIGDRSP